MEDTWLPEIFPTLPFISDGVLSVESPEQRSRAILDAITESLSHLEGLPLKPLPPIQVAEPGPVRRRFQRFRSCSKRHRTVFKTIPLPSSLQPSGPCWHCERELVVGEEVAIMACYHVFHPDCLWELLKEYTDCPVCQTFSIDVVSEVFGAQ